MIAAGILSDRRVELLNGEIIEMPPEAEPHAYYASTVGDYLRALLGEQAQIRESHIRAALGRVIASSPQDFDSPPKNQIAPSQGGFLG